MVDFDVGSRDHAKPLIDGQDTIISGIRTRGDGAEDMVEGGVGGKVPLHAVLLFGCIPRSDKTFDDAADLVDRIFHLDELLSSAIGSRSLNYDNRPLMVVRRHERS